MLTKKEFMSRREALKRFGHPSVSLWIAVSAPCRGPTEAPSLVVADTSRSGNRLLAQSVEVVARRHRFGKVQKVRTVGCGHDNAPVGQIRRSQHLRFLASCRCGELQLELPVG